MKFVLTWAGYDEDCINQLENKLKTEHDIVFGKVRCEYNNDKYTILDIVDIKNIEDIIKLIDACGYDIIISNSYTCQGLPTIMIYNDYIE